MYEWATGDRRGALPWALSLALECQPATTWGRVVFQRYPRPGAWQQQDKALLDAMRAAFRGYLVWFWMPANKMELQPADADFISWALNGYERP